MNDSIRPVKIDEEMRGAYLDYAMSVIVARALPDARDGLKPVHRRILYAMYDMGVRANSSYRKSARIVGEVLGKFHPHGDGAVYDAMARMAQDFSLRYLLIDGQGNFGSVDGDPPAAMRYTEARMSRLAEELLRDIEADTVDFVPNFDGSINEPIVLPANFPNLLVNGSSGIAVGMATNIPPHNLREIAQAVEYLINLMIEYEGENLEEAVRDVSVEDLMQFVKGPDFPTGALMGGDELKEVYGLGKGRIVMRAKMHVEEMTGGRYRIVVTEIPYQINKATTLERIASQVNEGKLVGIASLRDESDRNGMRIVIELRKGAQPATVINRLYKYSQLQSTFGVQMLALVDQQPRLLSLKRMLMIWIQHRVEVIERRSRYELGKARARAHILEGLLKAITNIDLVIQIIRAAENAEDARNELMQRFDLTETQASAILDLQLRRLAALERMALEKEYQEVTERIAYLEDLLASPRKVLTIIRDDLMELAAKYGDERRTQYDPSISIDFDESELVRDEEVLVSLTQFGYIKRTPSHIYRAQRRGGKGAMGMATRDEDTVEHLFRARSLDHVLFFSDKGKVYSLRAYQLPEYNRAGRGILLESLLALAPNERITAISVIESFENLDGYFIMCTVGGRIKRVAASEFESVRPSGLIAINLDPEDYLGWVKYTTGNDEILIVTYGGQSIRFHESEVRVMGRTAAGVNAMRMYDNDVLAGMDVITPEKQSGEVLIITEKGFGKRTPLEEFRQQARYGYGIRAIGRNMSKTGGIVGARIIDGESVDVTLITRNGISIRTPVSSISTYGRNARGVKIMNLEEDDQVVSMTLVLGDDDDEMDNEILANLMSPTNAPNTSDRVNGDSPITEDNTLEE
ncbi:MAG: DNA gyrase subunit A [Phototrophicales bacterium]|nr:MAG: DNA gyrase subunit A [Phototrophicales bacterium]